MNDSKIKYGLDALIKRAVHMRTFSIKHMGLGNMTGVIEDLNKLIVAHGADCTLEEFDWVDFTSTFDYTAIPFMNTFDKLISLKHIRLSCITQPSDEYKINQMKQRFR